MAFGYRRGVPVIAVPDLAIGPGTTLVVGPNGAGKSSLLKVLAGVERPDRGTVEIGGHDLWTAEVAARRLLAYVPEQPDLSPYARLDEVLALVCRLRDVSEAEAGPALQRAGLARHADRSIRELSMGERRRALLAAAWIGTPRLLLLDEPFDAMDRAIRAEILAWMDSTAAAGGTVLVVSHEIEPFVPRATAVLAVSNGTVTRHALPDDPTGRTAAVEAWARGIPPPG